MASGYQLVLELPVSQIQLLERIRPVFDVGKENVPENSHKVHIEHSGDDYDQWSMVMVYKAGLLPTQQ